MELIDSKRYDVSAGDADLFSGKRVHFKGAMLSGIAVGNASVKLYKGTSVNAENLICTLAITNNYHSDVFFVPTGMAILCEGLYADFTGAATDFIVYFNA